MSKPSTLEPTPVARLAALEAKKAALPAEYQQALTAGDAEAMRQAKQAMADIEADIAVARIASVRARIAELETQELPFSDRDLDAEISAAEAELASTWTAHQTAVERRNRLYLDAGSKTIAADDRQRDLAGAHAELDRLINATTAGAR